MDLETLLLRLGAAATALSAVSGALALVLIRPLKRRRERLRKQAEEASAFQKLVLDKLDAMIDDIGDLQYERLSQSHDFYTARGWCPTSKKLQLCQMYKSYTAKGRNHLSQQYEAEILALKESP